jgi:two-component system chemotaxis response regulator CheY
MKSALLVDNEPPICELLQEILKSEGMEAVTLANGSEAADYARSQKFDVVFVDSSSPVSDGIELTRKIRGSGYNRKTPIVMITSPKYAGFLTEGFEAGASFLVYKPIDRTRLLRLVRVTQGAIENEIRRFRRVTVEVKALVKNGDDEVDAATIDLSLNGAFVRARQIFPRGSSVKVSLFLGAMDPVVGQGSVMRTVSNDRMGIQLDRLPLTESARLQDFLLPLITAPLVAPSSPPPSTIMP